VQVSARGPSSAGSILDGLPEERPLKEINNRDLTKLALLVGVLFRDRQERPKSAEAALQSPQSPPCRKPKLERLYVDGAEFNCLNQTFDPFNVRMYLKLKPLGRGRHPLDRSGEPLYKMNVINFDPNGCAG
jgi:hypothetical protein